MKTDKVFAPVPTPSSTASSPGRLATALLLAAGPLLYALAAILLPQDANWDLRNYHWYNAYALLNGRFGFDLLPSQIPFFYNPLIDVPFYLLATHVPARLAVFCLALVQGLNFPLLWMLARTMLPTEKPRLWLAVATLGICGGGALGELGRTFYDNVVSLGVLGSLLLTVRWLPSAKDKSTRHACLRFLLAGLPVGVAAGLKQPAVIYCIGLCAAFVCLPLPASKRLVFCVAFGAGVSIGILGCSGFWMWHLWRDYGNPFFPYFNKIFHSPYVAADTTIDSKMIVDGMAKFWIPFNLSFDPQTTIESYWQDLRIAIWWGLTLIWFGLGALKKLAGLCARYMRQETRQQETGWTEKLSRFLHEWTGDENLGIGGRYLLLSVLLSYAPWTFLFGVYRYLTAVEMLAPLLIVLMLRILIRPRGSKPMLALAAIAWILLVRHAAALNAFMMTYGSWLYVFCRYRSPLPPLMACLPIALAFYVWGGRQRDWRWVARLLMTIIAISIRPGQWDSIPWQEHFVTVERPQIADPDNTMILMAGSSAYADVIPAFPPHIPFIRVQSRGLPDLRPDNGLGQLIAARIADHRAKGGKFLLLYFKPETNQAKDSLRIFHLQLSPGAPDHCPVVKDNLAVHGFMSADPSNSYLYLCPVEPMP